MRIIIGEGVDKMLYRAAYPGSIGFFYNTTLGGLISYLLFAAICILALIGLATVIIMISKHKKSSKDPYREWVKSGKYK